MYFSDTRAEALYTYDFGLATGEFANRKVLVDTSDKPFRIDRATVDMQGFYSGPRFTTGASASARPTVPRWTRSACRYAGPPAPVPRRRPQSTKSPTTNW